MITNDAFIKKWEGKRYREPGIETYECVALVKKYCEEVYGIKGLSFGGSALNGWLGKGNLGNYFDRQDMPKQGDLVFFDKTPTNPYGHVAVHIDDFTICEQNGMGGGNGLGGNAIRIHKAPANALGFLRPKPISMEHLLQFQNPDCSLASVVNCYRLNQGNDSRSFTQEILNEYMEQYINKHPNDAFQFLKDKGYNIKYLPLDFKACKTRLNKGSAIIFFLKGKTPSQSHYSCMKKEGGKYKVYDSTTPVVNALDDIDKPYNEGIFGKEFFQVR